MHGSKTVSVVLPAYNEEGYIRPRSRTSSSPTSSTRSSSSTTTRATAPPTRRGRRARASCRRPRQGYGYALQRGIREATGDIVILAEPDGTFIGRDVLKLLAYADDFDMVCGTRTTRELCGIRRTWAGSSGSATGPSPR